MSTNSFKSSVPKSHFKGCHKGQCLQVFLFESTNNITRFKISHGVSCLQSLSGLLSINIALRVIMGVSVYIFLNHPYNSFNCLSWCVVSTNSFGTTTAVSRFLFVIEDSSLQVFFFENTTPMTRFRFVVVCTVYKFFWDYCPFISRWTFVFCKCL